MLEDNEKQRSRTAKYRVNHKKEISDYNKQYYRRKKEDLKKKQNYRNLLKASRKWKEKNKDKLKNYRKTYYEQIEKPRRSKANSEIVEVIQNQNR